MVSFPCLGLIKMEESYFLKIYRTTKQHGCEFLNLYSHGQKNEKQRIKRKIFNEQRLRLLLQKFDDKMKPLMFLVVKFPLNFIKKVFVINFFIYSKLNSPQNYIGLDFPF